MDEEVQATTMDLLAINTRIAAVITAALDITPEEAAAVVASAHRTHAHHDTVVALFDPTAYRRDAPAIRASVAVLTAFQAFRRVLEEVRAK
jgi:hypothetical protein